MEPCLTYRKNMAMACHGHENASISRELFHDVPIRPPLLFQARCREVATSGVASWDSPRENHLVMTVMIFSIPTHCNSI